MSLVVRYDPAQNAYRFEFRDEDNPDEVTSNLSYEPRPRIERLVADLDELAKRPQRLFGRTDTGLPGERGSGGCGANWFPRGCASSSGTASTGYGS